MIYGSVCSGIEAATVAWHPLGWRPAFFAEIEAFPSAVLKHHYPDVRNVGDFTGLIHAAAPVPSIDVLVGGTPCQSFSVAGLRRGLADARGGLTLEFVRLAQRLRPKWIVWENVPGVLSQDGGRAFGAFLGALGELGYGWAYRILDAQYYGVAQRRRRVFVVGHSGGDFARAAAVLFEPEGVRRDPPTRRAAREGASSRAAGCIEACNWDGQLTTPTLTSRMYGGLGAQQMPDNGKLGAVLQPYPEVAEVCGTISDGAYNGGGLNGQDAYTGRVLPVVPYDLSQITAPINRQNRDERSPCHTLSRGTAAHAAVVSARPVAFTGDGATADPISAHEGSTYTHEGSTFRLHNCVQQTMAVRRLTPVECERLQGFPDEYTRIPWKGKPASECPDGPRYKALGNSMAVPVMRWIGERIAKVEAV